MMHSRTSDASERVATQARRARIGSIWIDAVSFDQALDRVAELIESGRGGSIFTPNVDHVVVAETHSQFRSAYERASLVLADGMPVVWASRMLGTPLPEKVSGSDLIVPIARLAAKRGWRVYLLGGEGEVARRAADRLRFTYRVNVVGAQSPMVNPDGTCDSAESLIAHLKATEPHVVFVALGNPKQELWIDRTIERIRPAVAIGVGAGIDFLAGTRRRAPQWVSRIGLEWLFRLAHEPRRLARRYLLRDPAFLLILARSMLVDRPRRLGIIRAEGEPSASDRDRTYT